MNQVAHLHYYSTNPADEQEPCADCGKDIFYCEVLGDYFHMGEETCWLHHREHVQ